MTIQLQTALDLLLNRQLPTTLTPEQAQTVVALQQHWYRVKTTFVRTTKDEQTQRAIDERLTQLTTLLPESTDYFSSEDEVSHAYHTAQLAISDQREHPSTTLTRVTNSTLTAAFALGCGLSVFPAALNASRADSLSAFFPASPQGKVAIAALLTVVNTAANFLFMSGSLPENINHLRGNQRPVEPESPVLLALSTAVALCAACTDAILPAQGGPDIIPQLNAVLATEYSDSPTLTHVSYAASLATLANFVLVYGSEVRGLTRQIQAAMRASDQQHTPAQESRLATLTRYTQDIGRYANRNRILTGLTAIFGSVGLIRTIRYTLLTKNKADDVFNLPGFDVLFAIAAGAGSLPLIMASMTNLARCSYDLLPCMGRPSSAVVPAGSRKYVPLENSHTNASDASHVANGNELALVTTGGSLTTSSSCKDNSVAAAFLSVFAVNAIANMLLSISDNKDGKITPALVLAMACVLTVSFGVCARYYLAGRNAATEEAKAAQQDRNTIWSSYGRATTFTSVRALPNTPGTLPTDRPDHMHQPRS